MAPEIKLLLMLSGSALRFHLSNTVINASTLPYGGITKYFNPPLPRLPYMDIEFVNSERFPMALIGHPSLVALASIKSVKPFTDHRCSMWKVKSASSATVTISEYRYFISRRASFVIFTRLV